MESRVEQMHRMRVEGMTLAEIGSYFGISRERVRQLLVHTYGTSLAGDVTSKRHAHTTEALDAYRASVVAQLAAAPGSLTAADVVRDSPVRITSAASLLGEDRWLLSRRQPQSAVDEATVIDALQRVWKRSTYPGPLTRTAYALHKDSADPSPARVCQRYRWSDICKRAGVPSVPAKRSSYPSAMTTEDAIQWVLKFIEESADHSSLTSKSYNMWASEHSGAPSTSTIINTGLDVTWDAIRAEAIKRYLSGSTATPEPVVVRTVTDDQVAQWVTESESGMSARKIARKHGVSPSTVSRYISDAE